MAYDELTPVGILLVKDAISIFAKKEKIVGTVHKNVIKSEKPDPVERVMGVCSFTRLQYPSAVPTAFGGV